MKKHLVWLLLLGLVLLGCGQTPVEAAQPAQETETVAITEEAAPVVTLTTLEGSASTEDVTNALEEPAETTEDPMAHSAEAILEKVRELVSPREPLEISLSVPTAVTVTASSPTVDLPCTLTRTGDGPDTGRFQVYQNGEIVWDVELALQTSSGPVRLTYDFTRYMTQTTDTVTYVLTYGDQTLTAETTVTLENWPDEVYAKASGDSLPYYIEVVKNHNVVLVYGKDSSGAYTQLVHTFLCSTGASTPLGSFKLSTRYEGFHTLFANAQRTAYCYGQYAIVINGNYLFHSVPYYTPSKSDLEYDEFNKLGTQASLGCIRLAVQDVKWLYDNCPYGTPVKILEREVLGVEKPANIILDTTSPNRGWDPTDPDPANPWNQ